jgi:CBS-domain-containing membrane protein
VVDGERLVTVLESADLPDEVPDDSPADDLGTLAGRTVAPDADLAETRRSMLDSGRYRLAVVDEHGTFHGLLCLTHDGQGFCSGGGDRA